MRRRGKLETLGPLVDRLAAVDGERRLMIQAVEERKATRNQTSHEVARRKRVGEDAEELIARAARWREISRLEQELATTEAEVRRLLLELPNVTLPRYPKATSRATSSCASGVRRVPARYRAALEVAAKLGLFDLERGAKIAVRDSSSFAAAARGSCGGS